MLGNQAPEGANVQVIRESFGRVVYSHKTHEKAREIASTRAVVVKWINIGLTALTSTSILGTVITDQKALLYVSVGLATLALAFTIFQLSFDPAKEAERHRSAANELWYVREKYVHLLSDIATEPASVDIVKRRDELIEELKAIYKLAPDTTGRAYRRAQTALQINEDLTFTNEEINRFLPDSLRVD
ncbi:SLATT domain-containing protein [Streptomyces sp. RKAG293]|uniref:SLATT domain-containing protein n=1 Tax=Streptomyces sp. RKAG293 TaxID=2893403 RepID=UPI002034A449|nr:SLATT domain-containing protein [Streptomyces sp. RKAG293]MCM2417663.1 SLATT domain-containing protein [Streptomyces sp. RKAG293]